MLKLQWVLKSLFLLLAALQAIDATASVQVGGRHIYILYPGVDSIFGSYIFMVENTGNQPERLSFSVMLPTEIIDFQGQDNLGPDELKLGADGGLTIDKVFAPGDNMLNIGFKLPASVGVGALTLKASTPFETIGMFVFEGKFEIQGANLEIRKAVPFSGRNYDTYSFSKGEAGKTYSYTAQGVPEGRGRLWIIGWILMGAVLLTSLSLAWMSRPKLPQGAEDPL